MLVTVVGCLAGCDSSDDAAVERVSVSGQVTLDGQPLEAGAIVFLGSIAKDAPPVTAYAVIEQGRYAISAEEGPAAGTAHVVFRPQPLDREVFEETIERQTRSRQTRSRRPPRLNVVEIPDRYQSESDMSVELKQGVPNECDFDLSTR